MFQITAFSRDHSREVYEGVIIPLFQYPFGTHGYMIGEFAPGVALGVGPAVFQQWDDAIKGGFFVTE
jgi:hypothetical protein